MRIALVTGGQPRFTPDFIELMNQLQGFDSADIYMVLWPTDWATTEEQARSKIEKILLPKYKLAKIKIIDEPPCEYPANTPTLDPPREQNIAWWYKRLYVQSLALTWAFDLIDQNYDAVIRFRLDQSLENNLDISNLDLTSNSLLLPNNYKAGFSDFPLNDQFAVGTQDAMKFYCDFGKEIKELVPAADPNWLTSNTNNWTWGKEHLIGYYMKKYNVPIVSGDFGVVPLNRHGRSRFTDKHYHHGIAPDPTEQ